MGEVEYEPGREEWVSVTSSFINEQSYLPLLRLIELKKNNISRCKDKKKLWTSYNNNTYC